MCALTVLAAVAATGAAVSAVGAISQGQAAAKADRYNAQVASQNATAATQQADASAAIQQEQSRRQIGAATAAYGASGVTMQGTPMDVLANSASSAERDRQTILYKGHLQAAGYTDQANLDTMSASNDQSQGYMKATGILLSGGSNSYAMYKGL